MFQKGLLLFYYVRPLNRKPKFVQPAAVFHPTGNRLYWRCCASKTSPIWQYPYPLKKSTGQIDGAGYGEIPFPRLRLHPGIGLLSFSKCCPGSMAARPGWQKPAHLQGFPADSLLIKIPQQALACRGIFYFIPELRREGLQSFHPVLLQSADEAPGKFHMGSPLKRPACPRFPQSR